MATGVNVWSKTAATNNTVDSAVNWQEGQAPSSVNDSARGMMAATAKWRDDLNGSLVTAGSSTAYTVTTNQSFAALAAGLQVAFQMDETNAGTTTLAVDGLTAKPLRSAAGVELLAGSLLVGAVYRATYFTSNSGEWIVESYPVLGDLQVGTAKIATGAVTTAKINDAAVTLAKIESRTANTLMGRYTASTGAPQEVTVGAGLSLNTSTGALSAPAFPPKGSFSNLSIKVASNTTVTVAADLVTTTDGTNYLTTALSGTINLGTNGAANALDAGSIATSTWYAIWAIAKADGTTAGLASTSGSSPTLPTGYTYKARIGWVRTASGSAQLHGTWQFGRDVSYISGLAQTTQIRTIVTGLENGGSIASPTVGTVSISDFAPTTASQIKLRVSNQYKGNALAVMCVGPNSGYGGTNNGPTGSNGVIWPIYLNGSNANNFEQYLTIESSNIYWWSTSAGGIIGAGGWVDNI